MDVGLGRVDFELADVEMVSLRGAGDGAVGHEDAKCSAAVLVTEDGAVALLHLLVAEAAFTRVEEGLAVLGPAVVGIDVGAALGVGVDEHIGGLG